MTESQTIASLIESQRSEAVEEARPGIERAARISTIRWARSVCVLGADGGSFEIELDLLEKDAAIEFCCRNVEKKASNEATNS